MDKSTLESIIKEYSNELLSLSSQSSLPTPTQIEPRAETPEIISFEPLSEEVSEKSDTVADTEEESFTDEEGTALFRARVFSGNSVYPIKNAAVKIYKNNTLVRFLTTDENGNTKSVSLPSYPERNSLDADSEKQSLDYFADVFADGFSPAEKLLVSAVGGSEIILNVSLVPLSEEVI